MNTLLKITIHVLLAALLSATQLDGQVVGMGPYNQDEPGTVEMGPYRLGEYSVVEMGPYSLSQLATPPGSVTSRGTNDMATIWLINGSPIMPGSVECKPRATSLYTPSLERARQIRDAVRLVMVMDIESNPGCTYRTYDEWRVFTGLDWPTTFTLRPTYVMAAVPPGYTPNCVNPQGEPRWCGCAAGIGTLPAVVDISDNTRTESLIAWETCNGFLGFLGRSDLWDGWYVSSAVNRAASLVGGWRTQ